MTGFICESLARRHDRAAFSCGVPELDDYLQHRAGQDVRRRVAAVFVMTPEDEPTRIVGYYSLSAASLVLADVPATLVKKLPRYPVIPAILIGRLARDAGFPGLGKKLLLDALERSLNQSSSIGAALVLVDVKNEAARGFYERFGFQSVVQAPNRLFLLMQTVEKLLQSSGPN